MSELDELTDFARNWKDHAGRHAVTVVVPRGLFLQLIKEREARHRCAAVLKKTHKEMKRQKRMNTWGKDPSGRWA